MANVSTRPAGEMIGQIVKRTPKERRQQQEEKRRKIKEMMEGGYSDNAIVQSLHCGKKTVLKVRAGKGYLLDVGTQQDKIVEWYWRYLNEWHEHSTWPRHFFYWITTGILNEVERQLPSKAGTTRTFPNNTGGYTLVCLHLLEARFLGLIPWDRVEDHKNPELRKAHGLRVGSGELHLISLNPHTMGRISEIPHESWDDLVAAVEVYTTNTPPQFTNQEYYMVMVIEKSAGRSALMTIADRYGCAFQVFSGEVSGTRVWEACMEAKQLDKPMAIFYFSDLDIAGTEMPDIYYADVMRIYPRPDHLLLPCGLTRAQAKAHNLAEDTTEKYIDKLTGEPVKGYEKMLAKFKAKSGGTTAIELDGLEPKFLAQYFEEQIIPYANLEADKEEHQELVQRYKEKMTDLNDQIHEFFATTDLTPLQKRYEATEQRLDALNEQIRALNVEVKALTDERDAIATEVNDQLQDAVDFSDDEEEDAEDNEADPEESDK